MKRYGGAYDIGEYDYFTKEELVEFAEMVAEDVFAETGMNCDVSDVYIVYSANGNQTLVIELYNDYDEVSVERTIDMRRIRKPTDLFKIYLDEFVHTFAMEFEGL